MYSGAYSDPVISVRVLRLFRNKSDTVDMFFIAETMYNLSNTKLLLLVVTWHSN